jgi:hypothetical protein
MTQTAQFIGRAAATAILARRGFNSHDIECVLDLAGARASNGTELWSTALVERIAARAWWLGQQEARMVLPAAA